MAIKEALDGDCGPLARLIRSSFRDVAERFGLTMRNCPRHPSFIEEEEIREAMARGVSFYILEEGGEPRGCAALERKDDEVSYLERLAVLSAHRGRGLGRELVIHALDKARESGARRVQIGIIAEQAELADWYRGLGFRERGRARFEHLPFEVAFMDIELV